LELEIGGHLKKNRLLARHLAVKCFDSISAAKNDDNVATQEK